MLSIDAECSYADCCYAKCHCTNTECCWADCHYCRVCPVPQLSQIGSVVMLSVIMLAPIYRPVYYSTDKITRAKFFAGSTLSRNLEVVARKEREKMWTLSQVFSIFFQDLTNKCFSSVLKMLQCRVFEAYGRNYGPGAVFTTLYFLCNLWIVPIS